MLKSSKSRQIVLSASILSILLFSIFLLMDSGWAKEKIKGKVIKIRDGKLERFVNNKWRGIKKNSAVFFGDRLKTDKKALAVVQLPKIGRLVVGPDTEMELGKDSKDFKGNLTRGAIWLTSKLPKDSRVSITTSLATAGIRGTAFTACYDGKNFCACTCLGEVEVTLGSGQTIKVPKGEYISFASDSPAPQKSQSALPLIEKGASAFDFCFNCHIPGGKGKLKQDLGQYIPLQ
ncbi:MAG: FecR domain-containing protein [Nitrospirota bacterium]|jgi:hypothetical protein